MEMDFLDSVPVISAGQAPEQKQSSQGGQEMQNAVAHGQTLQKTETPYTTAVSVQKPRDLDRVVNTVMQEAQYAGDNWYYSWTVKGKSGRGMVEGGSIGLGYALARLWGNCVVDVDHEQKNGFDVFTARFVDLETGYTTTRIFRAKHNPLGGNYDAARKDDMTFQASQSKAIRNVILAGVPRWLVDAAVQEAKKATVNLIDRIGLHQAKDSAMRFFEGYGVQAESLAKYMKKKKDDWTKEDVAHLRGLASQIKDGSILPQEAFDLDGEHKPDAPKQEQIDGQTGEVLEKPKKGPEGEKAEKPKSATGKGKSGSQAKPGGESKATSKVSGQSGDVTCPIDGERYFLRHCLSCDEHGQCEEYKKATSK